MATKRPATEITVTRLDRIESKPIPWLLDHRIPLGMLSVLFGQPKVGKGVICADVGSRVTRGTLPGDLYGSPAEVMVAWSEDPSAEVMLRPRMEAVGADLRRVGGVGKFRISEDSIAELEARMNKRDVRFLVIDQLLDFLDPNLADKLMTDAVRPSLSLLADLADITGAAITVVLHETDKLTTARIMNATAFTAVPRVILRASGKRSLKEKSGWKKQSRNLQVLPSNIGATRDPLPYETEEITTEGADEVIRVVWLDEIDAPTNTAVPSSGDGLGQVEQAEVFLRDLLKRGPQQVPDIMAKADQRGLSKSALDRASRNIRVTKTRVGFGQGSVWDLP